jgi:hypothetical protein
MKRKLHHRTKGKRARTILCLPDLEHAKTEQMRNLLRTRKQFVSEQRWHMGGSEPRQRNWKRLCAVGSQRITDLCSSCI